jgi:hypothetical protein
MRRRLMRREGTPNVKRVKKRDGRMSLLLPGISPTTPPSPSNINTYLKDYEENSGGFDIDLKEVSKYLILVTNNSLPNLRELFRSIAYGSWK